jgi:phosphate transport system substrate-binding protein
MKSLKFGFALLFAALATQSSSLAGTLDMAGGTVPYKAAVEPRLAAAKQATGVEIKFSGVGTGNGMVALIEGKVPVAAVGEALPEAIEAGKDAAQNQGKAFKVPDNLVFFPIGFDEMQVIVHKTNPVTSLTKAQLKDIATGKITNWKSVGGPDLAIKFIVTKPGLAPGLFFQRVIMGGAPYLEGATEVQTPKEVITWVSRSPGGIGGAATIHMDASPGDAKAIKAPPLQRPLGLVTVGQPTGDAKKVVDFLKK